MDKKKILILSILFIFIVGMSLSSVSASKTITMNGYSVKLSDSEVKQLKNSDYCYILKSTGKKLTDKVGYEPIYKTQKVKKYKWVYKYKLTFYSWWDNYGNYNFKRYYPKTPKGYKLCGHKYVEFSHSSKNYNKYRKKVAYYTTKKVKIGKKAVYKTGTVKIGIEKDGNKCTAILFNDYPGNGVYRDISKKTIKL